MARVGASGAGELWRANDDVLGKDISLQFVPDKIREDAKAVGDVRQEIKRNRQLIHPNILRVYDFIEEPDWAAVSMDAFEGESLASLIGKRSSRVFSVAEVQPWITQLCQTLDDAHKIGLFHRDISPANIYFRPDGKLFLAGFGFSHCVIEALRRLNGNQGAVSANLSPQLLDGQPAARTDDIYACGALLFELLTGQAPFSGPEIADQIRNAAAKPVNELRPKDLEAVPESWEKAIAACLSKNPAERPASAGKLEERLTVAPASESSVLEMLTPAPAAAPAAAAVAAAATEAAAAAAPAEAKAPVPETTDAKETSEPVPAPAPALDAPTDVPPPPPAPASPPPSSFPLGRRNISTTTDPLAASAAPTQKTSPEKAAPLESSIPPKTSRTTGPTKPKTVKADAYSNIYGDTPRSPVLGKVLAAAALLILGVVGYHFFGPHADNSSTESPRPRRAVAATPPEDGKTPGNESPAVEKPVADNGNKAPAPGTPPQTGNVTAVRETPSPSASANPAEKALAQKKADLDKAKQAVADVETKVADLTKQQQIAEADAAAAKKALEEKTKSMGQKQKAVDEIVAKKKKMEDDQKAADAAALAAKQAADEKQRVADAAKQAVDDFVATNQGKLALVDQADAEVADMKKALEAKQELVATTAKARSDADAERVKQTEAVKASEQQVAEATAAIEHARQAVKANQDALKKLNDDAEKLQKAMQEQLRQIEIQKKLLESGGALPDAAPAATPSAATPVPVIPATPKKGAKATPSRSTSSVPSVATPAPIASDLAPLPLATPDPATPPVLVGFTKADIPKVTLTTPPPEATPAPGPVPSPANGVNSLGQKFVPVGDVEFCIWQTRVKDFEAFARAVALKSVGWRSPGFKQGPDHPVVNVTWQEAIAFCTWLTTKEHKEGSLPANQFYRLPTDLEWSKAVGLPEEPEKTPAERDMVITDVYPWGKDWPPPPGAGNYTGEETGSDVAIKGYNDGFAWTSPVGSFKPNKFGIYDMGGNVWQWCMDSWNDKSTGKVLRGASWYNGALKLSLLSSCRVHAAPDSSTDNYGFRIVKATEGRGEGGRAAKK